MRHLQGLTLIELTIALAVSIIGMLFIIMNYHWAGARQTTISAARQFGSTLMEFRERAIREQTTYVLQIDCSQSRYRIFKQMPELSGGTISNSVRDCGLGAGLTIRSATTNAQAGQILQVRLERTGWLPQLQFSLAHANGNVVRLNVDPLINEIHYEEY